MVLNHHLSPNTCAESALDVYGGSAKSRSVWQLTRLARDGMIEALAMCQTKGKRFTMINRRDTMIITRPYAMIRIREMGMVMPTAGVSPG